jgi:hypothetical protein
VTGYVLHMATPESGEDFSVVLDTRARSTQVRELRVGAPEHALTTGQSYRFRVVAYNFNGAGPASEIAAFVACGAPTGFAKPYRITSATAPQPSITIGWQAPSSPGGCPVLGYVVWVDDGAGGAFVEANEAQDPLVRDQPTLRQLQITRVSTIGATYRVKVVAHTEPGEVASPLLGVILAALPLQPPAPVLVSSSSASTTLDISGFPASSDGGCEVRSYDIQRDDGQGGAFSSLVGLSSPYLLETYTAAQSTATPIVRGRVYRFRYRASNCIGWGPLSPETQALAADPPQAPPSPTRGSTSSSAITLMLYPTHDSGGTVVTDYELERNDGDDGAAFTAVTSYDYGAHGFQYTLVLAAESMTAGKFYQFQFRAKNTVGYSPYSAVATFPVADAPGQPGSAPTLVSSSKTSIHVRWDRAADRQPPAGTTTGHYLYMDDGAGGEFSLVFTGAGYPELTEHTAASPSVLTGQRYRFYLVAENHVGLSPSPSAIAAFRACQAPAGLEPPERVATTQSTVTLAWSPPGDDGGCALTGYAILMGDEAAATPDGVPYSAVHAAEVQDRPSLSSFTVSLSAPTSVGTTLRFKLSAFNQGGFSTTSARSLRVVLATVPDAPAAAAARDSAVTSATVLKVTYAAPPGDGGSPITGYEVQMDDGVGGGFHTVAGGDGAGYLKEYFIAHGGGACAYTAPCEVALAGYGLDGAQYSELVASLVLVKGLTYRLRYRAANAIGWSGWSPVGHVQAAREPAAPPAPEIVAASATSVTVRVHPSLENNGAALTQHALYIDGGSLASSFTLVTGYDGQADTYTVTTAGEGILAGERYRFISTASNEHGESASSPEVRAAVGQLPATPAKLTRSPALSTRTQLAVTWAVAPDTEIPITGYALEWDNGEGDGVYYEIWNGRGRPEVLSFSLAAVTGTKYSFRHRAFNYNGESDYSEVLETYACESPSPPGRPTWVTSSTLAVTLAWERAADDGGCPVLEYRLYRDAGTGSGPIDTEVHATELRGNPQATGQAVDELPAGALGSSFVFQLKVFTEHTLNELNDGVPGEASQAVLYAGVPGAPPTAPSRGGQSDAARVHVEVAAVTTANGATVTSYEIQIDDGLGGAFAELQGGTVPSLTLSALKTTGVVVGRHYRTRYRALNSIGAGAFSGTTYILAAGPPVTVQVSGAAGQLEAAISGADLLIEWRLPENGGSEILEGQLELRHSDGSTYSEPTAHCQLAEDSTVFDGR